MKHEHHRNILYALIIFVALSQIVLIVVFSLQFAKLEQKTALEFEKSRTDTLSYVDAVTKKYDQVYEANFNEIAQTIASQETSFQKEIKLLRSTQEDFSGIVEDAVTSVVTVTTDRSLGTGFIISSDGYIVTNYHVIADNPNETRVLTYNRDTYGATVVGTDERRDLALLKISGNFKPLVIADSDDLQVGKKVIAIGNPLGLSFTVTEGIISGLHRKGPSGESEYIQTDVSLNPGNSGGPLIDTEGRVIGINNFKLGEAESIGFALESNAFKKGIDALAKPDVISYAP